MESLGVLPVILPLNITLFCFDFSGCGMSEGDYISLGYYEKDDLKVVIDYLRKSDKVSTIGLWGRSMGAVTSLMHASRDKNISGLVLDSPFSSLKRVAQDLIKQKVSIPGFVVSIGMSFLNSAIKKKAKFNLNALKPIDQIENIKIPALFVHGEEDNFI